MKSAICFLLFFLIAIPSAQGQNGRIMVVRDSVWQFDHRFEPLLPLIYQGGVDSSFHFPSDLSKYDAVFFLTDEYQHDSLSDDDQLKLIQFVSSGGKFYWESNQFLTAGFRNGGVHIDTLLSFLGITNEIYDLTTRRWDLVVGVDTDFARSINSPVYHKTQLDYDADGGHHLHGDLIPILIAEGVLSDPIAWIPRDRTKKIVLHDPVKSEYYNAFLSLVVCDYFGLCSLKKVETQAEKTQLRLSIDQQTNRTTFLWQSLDHCKLTVINVLGIPVLDLSFEAGQSSARLPEGLPSGAYFARLQSGSEAVQKSLILSK